jgi:hypothetical protein
LTALAVYVAAIWNTYRKTHLLMLDVIFRCKRRLQYDETSQRRELEESQKLARAILDSIPYHMASNPGRHTGDTESGVSEEAGLGKTAGGLLLLHPMWVITVSSVVSSELRLSARDCLAWIGRYTGIGQATVLARVSAITHDYFGS